MLIKLRRCLLIFIWLGAWGSPVMAGEPAVLVVRSDGSAPYQEAAAALLAEINRGLELNREVVQLNADEYASSPYAGNSPGRVQVALGVEACGVLMRAAANATVLCALLPRVSFERLLREQGRRAGPALSALYLSQPLGRQLDLARLALPQLRRVGVLWGNDSASYEHLLEAAAQARGLKVVGVTVAAGEPIINGLRKILEDADLLLAVADPSIYNSHTVQNILLTSFRAQTPMLAFSPAYVRAGALMAVYSTPAQIGQQAGVLARGVLQGQALGPPQYPTQFEVGVNEHVSRALGLSLDAAALTERLRKLERSP